MSASHADRQAVYESLEPVLGQEAALRLMDLLPIYPERELVSRTDMHANTSALRGEMAELRAELKGEMAELRTELKGEMGDLRSELRTDVAELRTDLTSEMSARFDQQTRWMVGLISTNIAALVGAVVAVLLAFIV